MKPFENLIKSKVCSFVRICDLIKINFEINEKELCLHIQKALFRVLQADKLLISSWDMYFPSKNFKKSIFKKFKWDINGNNLFDDEINTNINKLLNAVVENVIVNGKDLTILFENNLRLEILADTLKPDHEIYRLFELNNLDSHFVVES